MADSVFVVDDDRSMRWVLERALTRSGFGVRAFSGAENVLEAMARDEPDVVVTDIRMPGIDGLALLDRIHGDHPGVPVIVITAHSDLESAVSSYRGGAFEYLPKPFDLDEAVDLVRRACRHRREGRVESPEAAGAVPEIIGEAPAMQEVFRAIGRLARSSITVLITGESGTGKELVAHALHRHSPRADRPFVAINTAAIPRDLLESELFGHEKGAFTGAGSQHCGRFEQADGGTLFLDEIGDMPAELQTRLLRVLADGEFYRVGGHTPVRVDVRTLAATHQDLERRVREGLFREDLYHRLNVIRIHVPALRERRDDIPQLADYFLERASVELATERKHLTAGLRSHLAALDWPGNVRQLENTCRRLTVMASGRELHIDDLPPELRGRESGTAAAGWAGELERWARDELGRGAGPILDRALPEFQRALIRAALERSGGRRQEAARLLGWGRNTLTRKLAELDMTGF